MNIKTLMENIYLTFTTDERLLRYLYYVPENQLDKPQDYRKQNILDMPPNEKYDIIRNTVYFMDKKFRLDPKKSFSRINFYLGNRSPDRKYSGGAKMLINNPLVSRQEIIIDIYSNMEIHQTDMRMFSIYERIVGLLNDKNVGMFTDLKFDYSLNIPKTPEGFVGLRLIYYALDSQSAGCECN